ncbi:MAG: hypothetical protein IE884_07180 [Sulfuricurvum sp.]|nr:hypothetical protein [Sulfuricurvum sp.]
MKLGKLSLVAVMALGTSAFAIDNVKANGDVKVIYQTTDNGKLDMFDHNINSLAGVGIRVGATADLTSSVSAGVEAQGFTTLGLDNNLVGGVMATDSVDNQGQFSQAWLAATLAKTTAKIGRQELDTPLAFTEKWNVTYNTFDAAVVLNNDLPDTTLVGAWVGKHNGLGGGKTVDMNSGFGTFGASGAYAFAAVNKSIPNTTVQAWYYNVLDVADAYWLQADTKLMGMINLGLQYANMDPKAAGTEDTSIYAAKAAADVAGVNVYAAYSSADDSRTVSNFSNVATGDKSMIYTALGSIYQDGQFTTRSGTDAWKIGASTKIIPSVTLSASYGESDTDNTPTATKDERNAWDVVASTNIGSLGLTAIYTQYEIENTTTDLDTLRLIAQLKF